MPMAGPVESIENGDCRALDHVRDLGSEGQARRPKDLSIEVSYKKRVNGKL